MRIKSITIHGFGKFHDTTFDFDQGLNVVYGLNEQGKSTIHKFIEAMFYGFFKAYTKNRQYEDAYDTYVPWDHSGYGGTLTFEDQGQLLRMERQFTKGKESLKIFDVVSGEDRTETYEYNKVIRMVEPGIRHFGHNKITYKNTVSMTQMASKTDEAMITEIKDNMSNLASSHQTSISVDRVIDQIEKMQNAIGSSRKKTSTYYKLTQEIKDLKEELLEAEAIQKKITEEKQLENTLRKAQDLLKHQSSELKMDLGYIQAIKAKELLEKVQVMETEKIQIEKAMLKDLSYKDFDLVTADRLRVQANHLRGQRQQNIGLEEKIHSLEVERTQLAATIEALPDVDALSLTYEMFNKDVGIYREYKEKLATKESEHKTIQRQKEMLDQVKPPGNPTIGYVLAGILVVVSLWMGIQIDRRLLGFIIVGVGVVYWLYRVKGRQSSAYEAYTRKEGRLTAELAHVQQAKGVLITSLAKVLSRHDVVDLMGLQIKRDQALSDKSINENRRIDMEDRLAQVALMAKGIEGLKAQLQEQRKIYEGAKQLQVKAFKQFNIATEDGMTLATDRYLAYKRGVEQLKHVNERISDLLGGTPMNHMKAMVDVPVREVTIDEAEVITKGLEVLQQEQVELSSEISAAMTKQVTLAASRRSAVALKELLEEKEGQLKGYDHELAVARLMKETVTSIAIDIQNNFAPMLNEAMSEVVKTVTEGKYSDIKVNPSMTLTIYDEEAHRTINAESLSAGTIDILYFGLRLGISEVLTEGKYLPLMLDDTFVQYDDHRMVQVVEMLANQERQVLLFTCHTRELDYLDAGNIGYRKIVI